MPGTIAHATYSQEKLTPSRRLAIAVAGAVAAFDSFAAGLLDKHPNPVDVFAAASDDLYPEFFGDRQTIRGITSDLTLEKKKAAVARAIARARVEMRKLGGTAILHATADGILEWLDATGRAKWREALEAPGAHASVFFGHRDVIHLMAKIAVEKPALAVGANCVRGQLETQWTAAVLKPSASRRDRRQR